MSRDLLKHLRYIDGAWRAVDDGSVIRFDTEEAALRMASDSEFGLATGPTIAAAAVTLASGIGT